MRVWRLGLHGGDAMGAVEGLRGVRRLQRDVLDAAAILGGHGALRVGVSGLLLRARLYRVAAGVMVARYRHCCGVRLA